MCGDDGTRRERQTAVSEFEAIEWAEIRAERERQGFRLLDEENDIGCGLSAGVELLMWLAVLIAIAVFAWCTRGF